MKNKDLLLDGLEKKERKEEMKKEEARKEKKRKEMSRIEDAIRAAQRDSETTTIYGFTDAQLIVANNFKLMLQRAQSLEEVAFCQRALKLGERNPRWVMPSGVIEVTRGSSENQARGDEVDADSETNEEKKEEKEEDKKQEKKENKQEQSGKTPKRK